MKKTDITVIEVLSDSEVSELRECESIIEETKGSFIQCGQALAKIRDGKTYRATHKTFEAYCRERWGWGSDYSNKLISAALVVSGLDTIVAKNITTESQARALASVPPAQRQEVLETAAAAGPVTAASITRAARPTLVEEPLDPCSPPIPEIPEHHPDDNDSSTMQGLKHYWKKASKKERKDFLAWSQEH